MEGGIDAIGVRGRLKMKYLLQHSVTKANISVCREAFCNVYAVTLHSVKSFCRDIKEGIVNSESEFKNTSKFIFSDFETVSKLIDSGKIRNISTEQIADLIASTNYETLQARIWMQSYFEMIGDIMPNRREIHLDPVDKKEIWEEYRLEMINIFKEQYLAESTFVKLWRLAFSYVKIRAFKQVSYIIMLGVLIIYIIK
jgi:hypothetical protein